MKAKAVKYSTSFHKIAGQASTIRSLGILKDGNTSKSQMVQQFCLVEKNPALPKALNGKITTDILKSNDTSWNQKMKQFTSYFGKPASSENTYISQK